MTETRQCAVMDADGNELQRFTEVKNEHGAWVPTTSLYLHPGRGEHVVRLGVGPRGEMTYLQSRSLETHVTPGTRYATCPACGQRFHTPRRNAMSASSRVRSMVRKHFNKVHAVTRGQDDE